jgi:AraC-like DNA-binding protein
LLTNHLDQQGFKVMNIEFDPDNAWLDSIMAIPCGAIVLDCEPAAEWGLELMKNLRLHKEMQDIPIFFYNLSPEKNSGTFLDINYLTKPLYSDALVQALAQHGIPSNNPSGNLQTILVVDDEIETLRLNVQFIKDHVPSCQVLEAHNGRQALDQMLLVRPDLILLDLMMPELDGFGVLQAMQSQETLRTVPVIVMTGQVMTEETILRLNRSVAAILQKGLFSIDEILNQVDAALSRNKRLGSESQRIARRAMAYIHANYAELISRENIAQHIGVNERYMTHCFKQEVGVTPIKYLNRYRVKVAKQLLETENKSITEIGLDVGFTNSANFCRVFHDEVGMSPREYLRKKR